MTVSSTSSRIVYQGNGATTSFPFAFKVLQAADLVVVYTDATGTDFPLSPSQYAATGFGLDAGGTVTYPLSGSPIAAGSMLTIYRSVAPTQPASISNQGAMWPQVIEAALDRGVMIAQGFLDAISRALVVDPTDGGALSPLPGKALRANSYLAFDANGQPVATQNLSLASVSAWLATNFLPQTTAAAALAVLGGVGAAINNTFTAINDFTGGRIKVPTRTAGDSGTDAASTAFVTAAFAGPLKGMISGLTYQPNATTPASQIDIVAGIAADSTAAVLMVASAMTKKIDTAWVAGTNQGSLDTGAIGNGQYYLYAIATAGGAVDYLTSLSATAPTLPATYVYKRLIGWFLRSSGSVVAFKTYELSGGGLDYYWTTPALDVSAQPLSTVALLLTLRVPTAFSTVVSFGAYLRGVASVCVGIYDPDTTNANSTSGLPLYSASVNSDGTMFMRVRTNVSGQVKAISNASTPSIDITSFGFEWSRR